jgi:hypothetical protein
VRVAPWFRFLVLKKILFVAPTFGAEIWRRRRSRQEATAEVVDGSD